MKSLIHIGYPKCASTFVQVEILPHIDIQTAQINSRPLSSNTFDKTEYIRLIEESHGISTGSPFVFSNESISTFGEDGADRLHQCFPDAQIAIVIREQRSWLKSYYSHAVINTLNLTMSWEDFSLSFLKDDRNAARLRYDELIQSYVSRFSKENVTVVPFEVLKESRERFFSSLFSSIPELGCPPHLAKAAPRMVSSGNRALININRLLNIPHRRLNKLLEFLGGAHKHKDRRPSAVMSPWARRLRQKGIQIRYALNDRMSPRLKSFPSLGYSRQLTELTQELYSATNDWIQGEFDCDLSRYGYLVNKSAKSPRTS